MKKVCFAGLLIGFSFFVIYKNMVNTNYRYVVYLEMLPTSVNPFNNQINSNQYIISQLYYPLVERDKDQFTSKFLKADQFFSMNDGRQLKLCLKDGIQFSDGTKITLGDLRKSLALIQTYQPENIWFKLEENAKDCLLVRTNESQREFLEKLSSISTTVLKDDNKLFPTGLGSYRIEKQSDKELVLVASDREKKSEIKEVVFRAVSDLPISDFELDDPQNIYDLNHVFTAKSFKAPDKNTTYVETPILKSYVLGVFHPDKKIRENIFICLNNWDLSGLVSVDLRKIPGFLPKGVLGWDIEKIKYSDFKITSACGSLKGLSIPLYVYTKGNIESFRSFSEFFFEKTGFRFLVVEKTLSQVIQEGFSKHIFTSIIGFDTSGSINSKIFEPAVFFESFYRIPSLGPAPLLKVKKHVSDAIRQPYGDAKEESYRRAHIELVESHYVIPIGQAINSHFYDCRIKDLIFEDDISGTLKISDLKISRVCL